MEGDRFLALRETVAQADIIIIRACFTFDRLVSARTSEPTALQEMAAASPAVRRKHVAPLSFDLPPAGPALIVMTDNEVRCGVLLCHC